MITSSTCSPFNPTRLNASLITIAPNSVAGVLLKVPPKVPNAVRTAHLQLLHHAYSISSLNLI